MLAASISEVANISCVKQLTQHQCLSAESALSKAFGLLGKRWSAVVLGTLGAGGPTGFRELSRTVGGISDSVLSDRLPELTLAGLVTRPVVDGPPIWVTSGLWARGAALMPAFEQISTWAQEHL